MKTVPKSKAEALKTLLQKSLDLVQNIEEQYGDECIMDADTAQRINDILDSIGAFVINSL